MRKLLGILLLMFGLLVSVQAQDLLKQRVNLQVTEATLATALYQLIDEHNVPLSFRNDLLPTDRRYTLALERTSLGRVLSILLEGTQLTYRAVDQQILIIPDNGPVERERSFVISGRIRDAETGELLIGAQVVELYSQRRAVSNEHGFYSLRLAPGPAYLRWTYFGSQAQELQLNIENDQRLHVDLQGSVNLATVEVYYRDSTTNPIGGLATGQLFNLEESRFLPTLAGQDDLLRTAHLLPGVTTGADGADGLQIRGGDAGQNLVLLDGVPVYYVNHAIGLFSVFNNDAVRSAQLLRAGFPARYGGRLSSVLDIRTKEGNQQRLAGTAEAGLLTGRVALEGPIIPGQASFFVSGRWSFVHWLLADASRKFKARQNRTGETDYRFYDLNAKLNHTLSDQDRIYVSFYRGRDTYDDTNASERQLSLLGQGGFPLTYDFNQEFGEGVNWRNTVGSLRWNHLFSDELVANFSFTYSRLDQQSFYNLFELLVEENIGSRDTTQLQTHFQSGIEDLGLKADWQWFADADLTFRTGVGTNYRIFNPGALIVDTPISAEEAFANNRINTTEYYAYLEGEGRWRERWHWNIGLHAANWQVRESSFPSLQPRLGLNFQAGQRLVLNLSAGRMVQYLHFLRNTTINLPNDLWVPTTDHTAPAQAWMGNLGFRYSISDDWALQGDAYAKRMDDLIAFREGVEGFRNWEDNLDTGEGVAYGTEWQLRKLRGQLTGWVSYTLSRSEREFTDLNLGETFPFRYDRLHNVQLVGVWELARNWHFAATWGYASGAAITLPLTKFAIQLPGTQTGPDGPPIALNPEAKNNVRLPAYHRLDLNLNYTLSRGRWQHEFNLGVYNAYNRNNPLYYDVRRFLANQENELVPQYEFVEVQLAPILPSFSYQVRF